MVVAVVTAAIWIGWVTWLCEASITAPDMRQEEAARILVSLAVLFGSLATAILLTIAVNRP